MAWCVNLLSQLHWRRWGADWVVFDAASGMTHRLDTLSATSLLLLQEHAENSAGLAVRLNDELQIGDEANLQLALAAALQQLQGAGLVHCDPV